MAIRLETIAESLLGDRKYRLKSEKETAVCCLHPRLTHGKPGKSFETGVAFLLAGCSFSVGGRNVHGSAQS